MFRYAVGVKDFSKHLPKPRSIAVYRLPLRGPGYAPASFRRIVKIYKVATINAMGTRKCILGITNYSTEGVWVC